MAGIFLQRVKVFNRAPIPVEVMFDGEVKPIPPGESEIPIIVLYHAKNQNPIMGSADPNDPTLAGARYLIVEEHQDGYGKPLTKEEWEAHCKRPCRMDEEAAFAERYGNDPKAKLIIRNPGAKSTARSRYEAGVDPGGLASFTHKGDIA